MAKDTKKSNIPKIAAEKPGRTKTPAIGKIVIDKTPSEELSAKLSKLLEKAASMGIRPKFGRGTITLY